MHRENQVLVVGAVEERLKALISGKRILDEKVLLIVVHRVSEVHGLDAPAMPFKLPYHVIVEVLVVDSIVRAECGSIVIIDHGLVAMLRIVTAEVLDKCRNLTFELDVEGLYDIQAAVAGLTGDNPVDIRDNIVSLCFLNNCEF